MEIVVRRFLRGPAREVVAGGPGKSPGVPQKESAVPGAWKRRRGEAAETVASTNWNERAREVAPGRGGTLRAALEAVNALRGICRRVPVVPAGIAAWIR